MSNEVAIPRTADIVAAEIRALTASVLTNIIEIGRRMCEIKEMLPHGEFGEWIKLHTGYSSSTANNFMRLFQEYGSDQGSLFGAEVNCQTFGNLSYTKALALLAVPAEEREEFAKEHNAEELSTRELTAAIKARDEALKRAEDAENNLISAYNERDDLKLQVKELSERPVEVAVQEPDEKVIEEKVNLAVEELNAKHKAEVEKLSKELSRSEKKTEKLARDLEKAKADAAAAADEGEKARLTEEVGRLQKKLAMSGTEITTFKLHFSAWQNMYRQMMDALKAAPEENRGNLQAAVRAQLEAWTEGEV